MMRLEVNILADGESAIVRTLRSVIEQIEDGVYEAATIPMGDVYEASYKMEDPCPYSECDGSGKVQVGAGDDIHDQDCLCEVDRKGDRAVDAELGK